MWGWRHRLQESELNCLQTGFSLPISRKKELFGNEKQRDWSVNGKVAIIEKWALGNRVTNVMSQSNVWEKEYLQLIEFVQKGSTTETSDAVGLWVKSPTSDVKFLPPSLRGSQLRIQLWIHEHKLFLCDLQMRKRGEIFRTLKTNCEEQMCTTEINGLSVQHFLVLA